MSKDIKTKQKKVTRRDFIKGFSSGALGAAVAPKLLAQDAATLSTQSGEVPVYSQKEISVTVNRKTFALSVEPRDTLLDALRDKLNLTGAKRTCDRGECGGCTVLLDGNPVYACMFLAIRADGKSITTIEGLAGEEGLNPVQQAFIDKDAYQCGFCTPGFIMSSTALLKENKDPKPEDIKQALSGNLCRCGNYAKIFDAVTEAGKKMKGA